MVLTNAQEGTDGAIRRAREMVERHPEHVLHAQSVLQSLQRAGPLRVHRPRGLAQTHGDIDVFVAGMGTTGTLMGISRYLKERQPRCASSASSRRWATHPGPEEHVEAIRPRIYDPSMLDEQVTVVDQEAFDTTRLLAVAKGCSWACRAERRWPVPCRWRAG